MIIYDYHMQPGALHRRPMSTATWPRRYDRDAGPLGVLVLLARLLLARCYATMPSMYTFQPAVPVPQAPHVPPYVPSARCALPRLSPYLASFNLTTPTVSPSMLAEQQSNLPSP